MSQVEEMRSVFQCCAPHRVKRQVWLTWWKTDSEVRYVLNVLSTEDEGYVGHEAEERVVFLRFVH